MRVCTTVTEEVDTSNNLYYNLIFSLLDFNGSKKSYMDFKKFQNSGFYFFTGFFFFNPTYILLYDPLWGWKESGGDDKTADISSSITIYGSEETRGAIKR